MTDNRASKTTQIWYLVWFRITKKLLIHGGQFCLKQSPRMRANCCAWKYTPVEIHCLRITFGIRMVRFFAHFYLLVARNKYASNMAAYAQLNGITAPHVYLVIRQCSFVFSVKKMRKNSATGSINSHNGFRFRS